MKRSSNEINGDGDASVVPSSAKWIVTVLYVVLLRITQRTYLWPLLSLSHTQLLRYCLVGFGCILHFAWTLSTFLFHVGGFI
jgi:hypothetical protein